MVQAAKNATKKKDSFYKAKYNSLKFRLGSHSKATVAIANRMARAMYYILKDDNERFKDLGEQRADPTESQVKRAIYKLKTLGFDCVVMPLIQNEVPIAT